LGRKKRKKDPTPHRPKNGTPGDQGEGESVCRKKKNGAEKHPGKGKEKNLSVLCQRGKMLATKGKGRGKRKKKGGKEPGSSPLAVRRRKRNTNRVLEKEEKREGQLVHLALIGKGEGGWNEHLGGGGKKKKKEGGPGAVVPAPKGKERKREHLWVKKKAHKTPAPAKRGGKGEKKVGVAQARRGERKGGEKKKAKLAVAFLKGRRKETRTAHTFHV